MHTCKKYFSTHRSQGSEAAPSDHSGGWVKRSMRVLSGIYRPHCLPESSNLGKIPLVWTRRYHKIVELAMTGIINYPQTTAGALEDKALGKENETLMKPPSVQSFGTLGQHRLGRRGSGYRAVSSEKDLSCDHFTCCQAASTSPCLCARSDSSGNPRAESGSEGTKKKDERD